MAEVGSVIIGSKKIDIHAYTGDVISSSTSTDMETTYEDGHVKEFRKWDYNKFTVQAPDGSTREAEVDRRQATVAKGELVTLFWGVVGAKESDYLAVYSHATDKLGVVWNTRNDLAGPAFLRKQMVLTTLAILFLLGFIATSGPGPFIFVGLVGALWFWLYRRRQKLVEAVKASIPGATAHHRTAQEQPAVV